MSGYGRCWHGSPRLQQCHFYVYVLSRAGKVGEGVWEKMHEGDQDVRRAAPMKSACRATLRIRNFTVFNRGSKVADQDNFAFQGSI